MDEPRERVHSLVNALYESGCDRRSVERAFDNVNPTSIFLERMEEDLVEELDEAEEWKIYYQGTKGPFVKHSSFDSVSKATARAAIEKAAAEVGYRVNVKPSNSQPFQPLHISVLGRFEEGDEPSVPQTDRECNECGHTYSLLLKDCPDCGSDDTQFQEL